MGYNVFFIRDMEIARPKKVQRTAKKEPRTKIKVSSTRNLLNEVFDITMYQNLSNPKRETRNVEHGTFQT